MAGRPYQPLSAPVPAPVVVVSPQFCSPDVVPLTVTKKVASLSGGDFTVTDDNGAVVLQVKGSVFTLRNRRVLLDATGQPVLSMHEKVFSMHNRWEVFRGDSTNASDLLFTVKRSTLMQLRTELDVFLAGNTAQQVCDFRMKGSYFDRNCAFYLGDSDVMIAQIRRKYSVSNVLLGKRTRSMSPCSLTLTMSSSRLSLWFWMRFTAEIVTTSGDHSYYPNNKLQVGRLSVTSSSG